MRDFVNEVDDFDWISSFLDLILFGHLFHQMASLTYIIQVFGKLLHISAWKAFAIVWHSCCGEGTGCGGSIIHLGI